MIATVLLIAFTVAVGGTVNLFLTGMTKTQTGITEQSAETYTSQCSVGMLDIEKIYCTSDTDGLVGYWKLDSVNSSNYTLDISGHGNDGKLVNYPCNPATCNLTAGKYGIALKFDGIDDYVDAGNANIFNITDAVTFEVWANPNSGYGQVYPRILYNGIFQMLMTAASGNVAMGENSLSSGWKIALWSGPLPVGQWTHIVGTYDKSLASDNLKIYINGTLQGTANETSGGDPSTFLNTSIGGFSGRLFNGIIDEARIYNRALSPDEIQRHYQYGVALRTLIVNTGQTNLGKNFTLSWLVNNNFNSSSINLNSDLTQASSQWLSVYNITESGSLSQVRVMSQLCPSISVKQDVSNQIC